MRTDAGASFQGGEGSGLHGSHGRQPGAYPWGGAPAAAWLHQCPYAREPIVCCNGKASCWETVCSKEEKANFEVMRGFAHDAHAAHRADSVNDK